MGVEKAALSFKNVSKSFSSQKVLEDLSFDIAQGEIFGIVGESGSGKSTLLKIIAGNILPDCGEVLFKSKDVAGYSLIEPNLELQPISKNPNDLKRTVGYSPQDPSFYDKLTCQENIEFFGSLYNLPKEVLKVNIKILLKLVGLNKWNHKLAGDLSGGMQKRLDLACTLVHDPKILVLDEPTADIDFILREQMWELLRKIRQKGTTVVLSSHFIEEIEGLCDKIIILNNSKIEFIGSPNELKKRDGAGLVIKLKTKEKDYILIKKKLTAKYNSKKLTIKHKENSGYLLLMLKGIKDPDKEVPKILHIIKLSNQNLVEFNYSKEGISEIFLELHEKAIDAKFKEDELLESDSKLPKSKKTQRAEAKLVRHKLRAEKLNLIKRLRADRKDDILKKKSNKLKLIQDKKDARQKAIDDKKSNKLKLISDKKEAKLAKKNLKREKFDSSGKSPKLVSDPKTNAIVKPKVSKSITTKSKPSTGKKPVKRGSKK